MMVLWDVWSLMIWMMMMTCDVVCVLVVVRGWHAVLETTVPSQLVLLGLLDPGQHGDGEASGCGVVGDMFMEESDLAGVLCFLMVEFNQFVVGGDGGVCGGGCSLGYSGGRGGDWCWGGGWMAG